MTKEVLKLALEALYALTAMNHTTQQMKSNTINAIKEALAQPEQEPVAWGFQNTAITGSNRWTMLREEVPADDQYNGALWTPLYTTPPALAQPEQKYRRGNRLICLETEEYCVIHISGTDRQWVKFPDSHIGVYTNEQVSELFELLPKEPESDELELAAEKSDNYASFHAGYRFAVAHHLAQPEQEPVAWWNDTGTHIDLNVSGRGTPLYTHPVKDLEDININITWNENSMRDFGKDELNFARAILRKAQEK